MDRPERLLVWTAGLFEGEGCLSKANTRSTRIDIALHKRDLDVLKRLQNVTGLGKLYGPYSNNMIHWLLYGREACTAFLLDVWPYLGKRRRAKVLEHFPRFKNFKHHKG